MRSFSSGTPRSKVDLRLGLAIYWVRQPLSEILALIRTGESLGYDQLWITNEKFSHDMYVTATLAARETAKPSIGTFVSDPYSLHPAMTAMAAATLDEISGGRVVIGMGAGGTGFREMGLERRRPAVAIKESVLLIRRLLRGERLDFQGDIVRFNDGKLGIAARPDIPIIVASRGDLVLQTAGEVADGVLIATYAKPAGIRHAKAMIARGAARGGRRLEDLTLASRIDTCIHEDRRVAYDALKPGIAVVLWASYPDRRFTKHLGLVVPDELERLIAKRDYGLIDECAGLVPDSFVEACCWAGTVEDVARRVTAVVAEGIHGLTIMPVAAPGVTTLEIARAFVEEVCPRVRHLVQQTR